MYVAKSCMNSKMDWHSQTNIISMIWNGVESFAETKTNDWSETNQNLYDLKQSGKFCWNKDTQLVWDKPKYCASHLILSQYFTAAQLSNTGMSPKMDWHSQTNIFSIVWNGVENFAETKTNDWSETNQNIVPHTWRWANISQLHSYQNPAWVPNWIDILRQTLSLWFETEWKVLLKQRQTIGLRQTEKSCLTLHAEPIAWLKVHENEYLRIEH